ncbi:MAG: glutamate racemase [Spirochaetales bacterium]|nr:glutamate racemase [Spirochaetales bacterium]
MGPHIAFIDSGAGGLPYLARTRDLIPAAVFSYIADPASFPYGEKSPEVLKHIVVENVRVMVRRLRPDMCVVACNTASVVALDALRNEFPIPFVGVVPAVKPAALLSVHHRIGILATAETVGNPYTQHLIDAFANDAQVYRYAGADIIQFVEERFFDATDAQRREVIQDAGSYFLHHKVDTVVLGCTHFLHVKDELSEYMKGVTIVDSVEGVSRQTRRVAKDIIPAGGASVSGLYLAAPTDRAHRLDRFASLFGLEYKGVLG